MQIRIFQMDVIAGDPEANFRNIIDFVNSNMDGDLLILPEMCVGGYLVGDEWNREDYTRWVESYNEEIKELSIPISDNDDAPTIVWGNVAIDESKKNEDGRIRKYNAVWAACNGKYLKRELFGKALPPYQAKTLMPNYRFFDDKRYFTSFATYIEEEHPTLYANCLDGVDSVFVPFEVKSKTETYKVGLQVCEDMWYSDYGVSPTHGYVSRSADFIVNVSASPWTWGKEKARANVVKKLSKELSDKNMTMPPIFYANIVGAQNSGKNIVTFDGRSSVYGSNGDLLQESPSLFEEEVIKTEFPVNTDIPLATSEKENGTLAHFTTTLHDHRLPYEEHDKYKEKFSAIKRGLQHIALTSNQRWVIGLSGGIDSSVSAAILALTFGTRNVMGVNMPTKYNSKETKSVAVRLASNLGINYTVVPIESTLKAKRKALKSHNKNYSHIVTGTIHEENEQARLRGMILADIAAAEDAFFVNNGNKVETAAGYATLYGDVAGAVSPLADLTKEEVYGMAKYLNEYQFAYHLGSGPSYERTIPEEVILNEDFATRGKIKPSAELKEDQVDPLKFGFMCRLLENGIMDYKKVGIETVLQSWLDHTIIEDFKLDKELFYKYGMAEGHAFVDEINFVFKTIKGSAFKRVQAPPIIITSKSSFGFDYRESILPFRISKKAKSLMEKIKDQKYY